MDQALKAYLLLIVMLMQTLMALSPSAIAAQSQQLVHMAVHVQELGHHHHSDESLHLASDSAGGVPHFHADNGFQPLGLMAPPLLAGLAAPIGTPPPPVTSAPPSVFLEGLLRPPSATA